MSIYNNYLKLLKKELLIKCSKLGIKNYSSKNKNELIELIINFTSNKKINIKHLIPLFKWIGNKSDEIKIFEKYIPKKYNLYLEPFVGCGSVFFHINPKNAVISDINSELIDFYNAIKNGHSIKIYNFMKKNKNNDENYYTIRDEMKIKNYLDNAKRFYYQRKTCFRGLIRYNKQGRFNVPYGNYKTINFEDLKNRDYEKLLKRTEILNKNFEYIFKNYNRKSNFMFLNISLNNFDKHEKLAEYFKKTKIKCLMIIEKTNLIKKLYKNYIVSEYEKKYKFKLFANSKTNIKYLIIKNYK